MIRSISMGVIVAAPIHEAYSDDTTTLGETLKKAKANFSAVGLAPTPDDPCEIIADNGYHSRAVLKDLDKGKCEWKSWISEPLLAKGFALAAR